VRERSHSYLFFGTDRSIKGVVDPLFHVASEFNGLKLLLDVNIRLNEDDIRVLLRLKRLLLHGIEVRFHGFEVVAALLFFFIWEQCGLS
jgi:hypothetical protein